MHTKHNRPLFHFADDGEALYRQIERRTRIVRRSIRELCAEESVGVSTPWRWKTGKHKANTETLSRLEKRLLVWEREKKRLAKTLI